MKIVNQPLIESYRTPGPCRFCGKKVRMRCAAHIFSKGAGRVDIRCNLVQLGMDAVTDCDCHHNSHMGNKPTFDNLLRISAEDHKCRPEDIHQVVYFLRRMPKHLNERQFCEKALELGLEARVLVLTEFEKFPHLLD